MEGQYASSAAGQYSEVAGLRALAASAISDGDYSAAIAFSIDALRLSHDALSQLDIDQPSALPHRAIANAVLSDLDAARAIAIEPTMPPDVAALKEEVQVLAGISRSDITIRPAAFPRKCIHGRPSYDGECMRFPCI